MIPDCIKRGVNKMVKRNIVLMCIAILVAVILGGCSQTKNIMPVKTAFAPQTTEIIEVDKEKVSAIYISINCFVTEQVMEGEANISSNSEEFDTVVRELSTLQGKEVNEEEYVQGEAPQAEIYLYDKDGNVLENAIFGDFCVWRSYQVYKIDLNVYEKLGQLCKKYGKCDIYSVD